MNPNQIKREENLELAETLTHLQDQIKSKLLQQMKIQKSEGTDSTKIWKDLESLHSDYQQKLQDIQN